MSFGGHVGNALEKLRAVADLLRPTHSVDQLVLGCGATKPVRPSAAEVEAVKNLSGFSEEGAIRVVVCSHCDVGRQCFTTALL
jgi:hypothetical protein